MEVVRGESRIVGSMPLMALVRNVGVGSLLLLGRARETSSWAARARGPTIPVRIAGSRSSSTKTTAASTTASFSTTTGATPVTVGSTSPMSRTASPSSLAACVTPESSALTAYLTTRWRTGSAKSKDAWSTSSGSVCNARGRWKCRREGAKSLIVSQPPTEHARSAKTGITYWTEPVWRHLSLPAFDNLHNLRGYLI